MYYDQGNLSFPFHIDPDTQYVVGHFQVHGFGAKTPYLSDGRPLTSELVGGRTWYFYFPVKNVPAGGEDLQIHFDFSEGHELTFEIQIFGLTDTSGELVLNNISKQSLIREDILIC